ncbi:MAG: hypothetical protein Fur0027_23290 [Raineya sp.]
MNANMVSKKILIYLISLLIMIVTYFLVSVVILKDKGTSGLWGGVLVFTIWYFYSKKCKNDAQVDKAKKS